MEKVESNKETFLKGIHLLTGIDMDNLREYSEKNDIMHIIDHPMVVNATERQMEKLQLLKQFINSYQYLRLQEEKDRESFNTPEKLADYFRSQLAFEREKEYFLIAYFNAQLHLLSCEKFCGTVNKCQVHMRECVKRAIQLDCSGIVLSHNHPGGSTQPSREDIELTKRFIAVFESMNISVYDHIIIGNDKYNSLKMSGYMEGSTRLPEINDYTPFQISNVSEMEEEELEP